MTGKINGKSIQDPAKLAWKQANSYFPFLIKVAESDVRQELALVVWRYSTVDRREFNNAVNRALYRLAVDLGFRKGNVADKQNKYRGWYPQTEGYKTWMI